MPATTEEEWETTVETTGHPEGISAKQLWEWLTARQAPHIPLKMDTRASTSCG